jgi:hypothetical protein
MNDLYVIEYEDEDEGWKFLGAFRIFREAEKYLDIRTYRLIDLFRMEIQKREQQRYVLTIYQKVI